MIGNTHVFLLRCIISTQLVQATRTRTDKTLVAASKIIRLFSATKHRNNQKIITMPSGEDAKRKEEIKTKNAKELSLLLLNVAVAAVLLQPVLLLLLLLLPYFSRSFLRHTQVDRGTGISFSGCLYFAPPAAHTCRHVDSDSLHTWKRLESERTSTRFGSLYPFH